MQGPGKQAYKDSIKKCYFSYDSMKADSEGPWESFKSYRGGRHQNEGQEKARQDRQKCVYYFRPIIN